MQWQRWPVHIEDLSGQTVRMNCRNCRQNVLAMLQRTLSPAAAWTDDGSNDFAGHFAHCPECRYTAFDHWNWSHAGEMSAVG
jgi:hypothetical protein